MILAIKTVIASFYLVWIQLSRPYTELRSDIFVQKMMLSQNCRTELHLS